MTGSRLCTCRSAAEQETRDDVFIWRGDTAWWSCMACDQRVRLLSLDELADRAFGPLPSAQQEAIMGAKIDQLRGH